MFSKQVLDHFHNPRHVGEIENPTVVVEMSNPVCGDLLKLWVVVRAGTLHEVKFKIQGCVASVACASWLAERVMGKPLAELAGISAEEIAEALGGLPPASRHAAALAADTLRQLLEKAAKAAG